MQHGTVKWFNDTKGYGFINPEGNPNKDVFVHYTDVQMDGQRTLNENQKVDFEETEGKDGRPKAINVKPQ